MGALLNINMARVPAPTSLRIEDDGFGVRTAVTLASPAQVHLWAREMGAVAVTREPRQITGTGFWYRFTEVRLEGASGSVWVGCSEMREGPAEFLELDDQGVPLADRRTAVVL